VSSITGWWGLSRHFHYVPEITAAFLWSVPGGFTHLLPYFYVVFLTLLLTVLFKSHFHNVRSRTSWSPGHVPNFVFSAGVPMLLLTLPSPKHKSSKHEVSKHLPKP